MSDVRRLVWGLIAAAGLAPAGCGTLRFGQADPASDPGDGIRVPKPTKFASLVKAPGETVSLTGSGPTAVVATTAPPPVAGTVTPPTPKINADAIPSGPTAVAPNGGANPDAVFSSTPVPVVTDPFLAAARAAWDGRPDKVADALRPLDPPTQEALHPLLLAGAGLALGQAATDPRDLRVAAERIRTALAAVERRDELRVENARFVDTVKGYRWYDPLPDGHIFRAGEYLRLYAEITPLAVDPLPG